MITTEKIKEIIHNMKISQEDFAESIKVSPEYLSRVLNEKVSISHKFEDKLKKLGYLTEEIQIKKHKIPVRRNIHASAGNGCFVSDEQITEYIEIEDSEVKKLNLDVNNSDFIIASGDSMQNIIFDGDELLVDKSKTDIIDGKIYVIRQVDLIMVKRLQKLPDGIRVISDNKDYESYKLIFGQDDFQVCGRVIKVIKYV